MVEGPTTSEEGREMEASEDEWAEGESDGRGYVRVGWRRKWDYKKGFER